MLRAATLVSVVIAASCRSGFEPPLLPCQGITCSDHGRCAVRGDAALCLCDPGYVVQGVDCVAVPNPCATLDCSGHGRCGVWNGVARCQCDPGYRVDDTGRCGRVVSPCENVTCDGHGTCVVPADGQPRCACDPGYRGVEPARCELIP